MQNSIQEKGTHPIYYLAFHQNLPHANMLFFASCKITRMLFYPVILLCYLQNTPGGGEAVGHKIDTYVRLAAEKIDQVGWKFFMKKGGRSGGKLYKERPYFI